MKFIIISFLLIIPLFRTDRLNNTAPPTTKNNPTAVPSTASSPDQSSNSNSDKKKEENEDVWGYLEAQASFLGPSLWDNGDLKVRLYL